MSSLKKFAVATPRPLPVIVLADTSGSMGENGKIEALNAAMKDMVSTFAKESRLRAEIQVGLITFGGKAQMHLPLVAAHGVAGFSEFKADGVTPMVRHLISRVSCLRCPSNFVFQQVAFMPPQRVDRHAC